MNLATVLGLVVSLLAVIATVGIGALRFRHEQKLADIADARSILAEGALELGRMKGVMKDTLAHFEAALTGKGEWPPDTKEKINAMEVAAEALESALAAVRIRFKHTDNVVTRLDAAYDSARSALITYSRPQGPAWLGRGHHHAGPRRGS